MAHRRTRLGVIPAGFSNSFLVPRDGQIANVLGHVVPIVAVSLEHAVVDITDVQGVSDRMSRHFTFERPESWLSAGKSGSSSESFAYRGACFLDGQMQSLLHRVWRHSLRILLKAICGLR